MFAKNPRGGESGVLGHAFLFTMSFRPPKISRFLRAFTGWRNQPSSRTSGWSALDWAVFATVWVREFSRGMRQRLAVARAFIHQPQVLIFDEPFTALDDRAIAVLQSLLAEAHAAARTIIMSTHQLREALEIATHVALIQRGQLAFSGERTQQMVDDTGWLYRNYGEN